MRRGRAAVVGLALAAVAAGALLFGADDRRRPVAATLSVAEALAAVAPQGFARALAPRTFSFPADHGPHPDYRTEWWYWTGNLAAPGDRHFGVQLTFFRTALAPRAPARASAWAATQIYLAHFALTDTVAGRFQAWGRASREALGLAGATARPFRVWVEDWSVEGTAREALPMRLSAAEGEVAVELALDSRKPIVLQGAGGLSQKGPEPGNASHYYSLTRMTAHGTIRVGAETFAVSGLAWMDREWSTSALGPDLAGWDWFALQLTDERELMVYRLRRKDGRAHPLSAGTLVEADGSARALGVDDVRIEILGSWASPRSGVVYPARWRVVIPGDALDLEVAPRLPDQEVSVDVRYWEGAVTVRGSHRGRRVTGTGYVELVGYGR